MAGKIVYTPALPTACQRGMCEGQPDPKTLQPGTIWECDHCHGQWVVVTGSQYNEYYQAWRHLTERNRKGADL